MTIIVAVTIFGSTFAQFCGYAYLLCEAGKEGYFFESLGHMSEVHEGLADNALLLVGLIAAICCFFSIGQAVGLMLLRYTQDQDTLPQGWRMPFFPIPCIIQIALFLVIFVTTDSVYLWGSS